MLKYDSSPSRPLQSHSLFGRAHISSNFSNALHYLHELLYSLLSPLTESVEQVFLASPLKSR